MSTFGDLYSKYYDLLYRDKNYQGEADYIHRLIQKYHTSTKEILELGCGTGRHAELLSEKGYFIHGVDRSEEMVQKAKRRCVGREDKLTFDCADIMSLQLGKKFDVVISLFHVMSYQVTNEALRCAFETASIHLKIQGIFIFDFWYGPAVLTDKPSVRIKRIKGEDLEVLRIAEPTIQENENSVDVNYHIIIKDLENGTIQEKHEQHRMRYLFLPEIRMYLKVSGFELVDAIEWLTDDKPLGLNSWNGVVIARKSL